MQRSALGPAGISSILTMNGNQRQTATDWGLRRAHLHLFLPLSLSSSLSPLYSLTLSSPSSPPLFCFFFPFSLLLCFSHFTIYVLFSLTKLPFAFASLFCSGVAGKKLWINYTMWPKVCGHPHGQMILLGGLMATINQQAYAGLTLPGPRCFESLLII